MKQYEVRMLLEDDGIGANGETGVYLSLMEVKDWLLKDLFAGLDAKEFTIKELQEPPRVPTEVQPAPCVR